MKTEENKKLKSLSKKFLEDYENLSKEYEKEILREFVINDNKEIIFPEFILTLDENSDNYLISPTECTGYHEYYRRPFCASLTPEKIEDLGVISTNLSLSTPNKINDIKILYILNIFDLFSKYIKTYRDITNFVNLLYIYKKHCYYCTTGSYANTKIYKPKLVSLITESGKCSFILYYTERDESVQNIVLNDLNMITLAKTIYEGDIDKTIRGFNKEDR